MGAPYIYDVSRLRVKTGPNYFILQIMYYLHSDLIYLGMCMNDSCKKCNL